MSVRDIPEEDLQKLNRKARRAAAKIMRNEATAEKHGLPMTGSLKFQTRRFGAFTRSTRKWRTK